MSVAIVTGASSGIGLAVATALAARGYAIVANSRRITPKHPSIAQINARRLAVVPGDVADPEVAERVVGAAVEQFGGVDLLVNNAGIFIPKPFTAYTRADFDALLGTNVYGFLHLTQRVLGVMAPRGRGHIVNITTSLAENPLRAVPSAVPILTKSGLNGATRALAQEFAYTGIRINAVSPGLIRTPMHAGQDEAKLAALHPVGRLGEVDDVVRGVLYLEDAPFVTGEILHVDGGAYYGRW